MKKSIVLLVIFCALAFTQEIGARYLIITHDNFYDAIQPLAQWKHKKGLRTKITRLSEIGSSQSQIRTYIQSAYNTWQIPPEFVLLVGAPNYLPFGNVSGNYSDNYYTDIEGDLYNEILSGRLTVHNTTEAQTVVNKILLYERTPYIDDSLWFINACLIANEDNDPPDDSIYWSDIHHAKNLMLNAGYNIIDTLSYFAGDDKWDVIDCVNNGRGFVLYRGQGVGNWWSPFDVNPSSTANGEKLPIVLSITCITIGTGSTPATAEGWLLTGSPTIPKGAAGYFATTTIVVGQAYLRSAVSKGFFDAVFVDNKRTFGEACEGGRKRAYEMYPSQGGRDEYFGFTTIGDPEMNIWTAIPQPLEVIHSPSLYTGDDSLHVQVHVNSVPFESALVCIVLDTLVYQYGYTSGSGDITFDLDNLAPGEMDLTVTGKNVIPYEATIVITDTMAYLTYLNHTINDSLANNNGSPESGETILLRTFIKNIGVTTANKVLATLNTSDALLSIIDSVVSFGDLQPQDSSYGMSPFVFTISPFCPGDHVIDFTLTMSDVSGHFWTGHFSIVVENLGGAIGPDTYGYYLYDDTDTLTGNAPTFTWFEIAPPGPGSLVSEITNQDADTVTYALPFTFKYYGTNYNSTGMCSNGFLEMGYSTYRFGDNGPLPSTEGPRRLLAPFWDDLDPSQYGDIYYYDDTGNHRWIIEYKNCAHYENPSLRETFQVILLDPQYYLTPTSDGEILYLYSSVADASGNTVGVEDDTQQRGLQYLFDNNYHTDAAPVVDNRALLITTKQPAGTTNTPWLYITNFAIDDSTGGNDNGIAEPDETIDIYISIKNDGDTTAHNIVGTLRCSDTDADVLDSISNFGNLPVGATTNNTTDPYSVHISVSPEDTTVGFILSLTSNDGTYYKDDYFTIYLYEWPPYVEEHEIENEYNFGLKIFPNPFRKNVLISYSMGNSAKYAELKIYDVTGRLVRQFNHSTIQQFNQISWDGTDDIGRTVPQGIYFVHFISGSARETLLYEKTEKVIFLK
jgi:hypothetical protein